MSSMHINFSLRDDRERSLAERTPKHVPHPMLPNLENTERSKSDATFQTPSGKQISTEIGISILLIFALQVIVLREIKCPVSVALRVSSSSMLNCSF